MRVLSLGLSVPKIRFCNNGDEIRSGRAQFAALLEEIVGSQHHRSFSVDWPFEEPTRCLLLNCIAQPQKLIYSLICLHLMLAFKIVHRRGADRTPHCLALIKHREINDHPIEVVAQYFASLQRHCKSSVLKRSDYAISAGLAQPAIAASKISEFFEVTQHLRCRPPILSEGLQHIGLAWPSVSVQLGLLFEECLVQDGPHKDAIGFDYRPH